MTCKHCSDNDECIAMDTKGNIKVINNTEKERYEPFDYTYCECDCHMN